MKSIKKNISNEIIINKSKFITKLYKVNNEEEVINKLNDLKDSYKDATHICYGYIIDNVKRFNDDGEPGRTAGMPILNVLEKNELNYILCVVIRYFGGIKLGAGGLVRAYSNSVSDAIKLSDIIELIDGYKIEIKFKYDNIKTIDNLLKDVDISYKEYDEDITYEINIEKDNCIINSIKELCISFEIIDSIKISKDI